MASRFNSSVPLGTLSDIACSMALNVIRFRNVGTVPWSKWATRIGTSAPRGRQSPFYAREDWLSVARPTGADSTTWPGEIASFSFVLRAPSVTGMTSFEETWELVHDPITWFGPTVTFDIVVKGTQTIPTIGLSGGILLLVALGTVVARRPRFDG